MNNYNHIPINNEPRPDEHPFVQASIRHPGVQNPLSTDQSGLGRGALHQWQELQRVADEGTGSETGTVVR